MSNMNFMAKMMKTLIIKYIDTMNNIFCFTFITVLICILTIISCNSNNYEEFENGCSNFKTRSSYNISIDDIQKRLNDIGKKYRVCIMLDERENISLIDDNYFITIENQLKQGFIPTNIATNEREI